VTTSRRSWSAWRSPAAARRQGSGQGRGQPRRQVLAALQRPHLPAEDIALGYKQLLEVKRGWRDLKQVIDLRPVYHRLEERIRAHVVLCWLALLLVRIVETTTGATWRSLAAELNRLQVITFTGPDGTYRQRTELTKPQRDIYATLQLDPPTKIIELATATP